jgi:hypothetical protein
MHNIIIPRYANLTCSELGHDSPQHVGNKFCNYTPVQYHFNANGFRTHDFSEIDSDCILVFGDSFTLGLGTNIENRFTDVMQQQLGLKVFNISLNGASNDWIARRVVDMLNFVQPRAVVIHYTFSHRREHADTTWFDDERTLCEPQYTDLENFYNWQKNFNLIVNTVGHIPLIHSFIPTWHTTLIDYLDIPGKVLPPVALLDTARDGFHYGIKTHQRLAHKLTNLLVHESGIDCTVTHC